MVLLFVIELNMFLVTYLPLLHPIGKHLSTTPFRQNGKILKKFSVRFADIGKIVYFLPESNEKIEKIRLFSGRVIWSGRLFRLCKIGKIVVTGHVEGAILPFLPGGSCFSCTGNLDS
jgi:hypothetical protein